MFISYFVSFVLHFVTIRGKSCKRFRHVKNIAVDPSTCRMEMSSTPDWSFSCVEKCDQNQECTGVALESTQQSYWCCFFTENPIGVKSGSNVLIHKPEVQTGCLFGFDPETNCSQCILNQWYQFQSTVLNGGFSINGSFIIVLSGDLCVQIGGNVQNHGNSTDIVSGEIDRGNKTWIFEAENETKFRATLLNGNMVNGTGNHPLVGEFTFTATTTN